VKATSIRQLGGVAEHLGRIVTVHYGASRWQD
jgi:hypothetical protein